MSRPQELGPVRFQLDGEEQRAVVKVQNIGSRKPVEERPVQLHFVDTKGRIRKSLQEIFPVSPQKEPPVARVVAFRKISVELLEDDEVLIRVRRGVIEAVVFAQYLGKNMHDHRQLLTFFLATLFRHAFCDCECAPLTLRKRHSESVRSRVTELLRGIVINNGAFLQWLPNEAFFEAQKTKAIEESALDEYFDDEDAEGMLTPHEVRQYRSDSRRLSQQKKEKHPPLSQWDPQLHWNQPQIGSLKDVSEEPNCEDYQTAIEEAIQNQLKKECA